MRVKSVVCALFGLSLALSTAARAEDEALESNVLHRLMDEPITMFDWGLHRLDRDIAQAMSRVFGGSPVLTNHQSGALYEWRQNKVTVYVSARAPDSMRSRKRCHDTFGRLVSVLTERSPAGPGAAGWYLMSTFYPQGRIWPYRFEDVGEQLLREIVLEVTFFPPGGDSFGGDGPSHIRCSGRLDAKPADLAYEGS